MKKYFSVFYLAQKESFRKILLLWLASFIVQGALCLMSANSFDLTKTPVITVANIFDKTYIPLVFGMTFAITAGLLVHTSRKSGAQSVYTLKRLLVDETAIFNIRTVYNALIFLLLLMLSVTFYFCISIAAARLFPEGYFSSQAPYISLYSYKFFHNIFAGRDILRLIRNILCILSAASNLSAEKFYISRKSSWAGSYFSVMNAGSLFTKGADMENLTLDIIEITVCTALIFASFIAVKAKEKQYE